MSLVTNLFSSWRLAPLGVSGLSGWRKAWSTNLCRLEWIWPSHSLVEMLGRPTMITRTVTWMVLWTGYGYGRAGLTLTLKHGWGRTYAQLQSFGYLPFNPHVDLFQKAFVKFCKYPRKIIPQVLLQVHAILVVATLSPEADEFTAKEERHLTFKMDRKIKQNIHVHDSRYMFFVWWQWNYCVIVSTRHMSLWVYLLHVCHCVAGRHTVDTQQQIHNRYMDG